ncbi:MAG TPA: F0F1 ATP synthase subunit alpha, partial [Thiolapillus brandeum]|nr:F0F1 ATP synthase subunit alpha [Thiolapillus brandeum]
RELAAFSQFASDLDEATRKQLERGQRVTELMKQGQYSPMSIAEMAISLFAANEGYLDDVEAGKVVDFEAALISYMNSSQNDLMDKVNENGDWNDEIENAFHEALKDFKANHSW